MRARRRFGQHFLEPAWVRKVVDAIAPAPDDCFLEIGPGRGALTEPLAARSAAVVAIEVDRDLSAALIARQLPNVTVVNANVLAVDLAAVASGTLGATTGRKARVVGNLPYNISSPILFRLISAADESGLFDDGLLMLQKEVADRLVARPGTGEYGVLTVLTALSADVTTVLSLPPGAFRPVPKIRSTVVRLRFRPSPVPVHDRAVLVELVRSIFTQRRKTLSNALGRFATGRGHDPRALLEAAGIDGGRRPETLQLVELARLADTFRSP
jgi:16S rRNA (adenine1518-N6/adenine1519-N6)-dimethyltransferase